MSTYIRNLLTVTGEAKAVKRLFNAIKSDDDPISFERIDPVPNIIRSWGVKSEYDWKVDNWGTDWDAQGLLNAINGARSQTGPIRFTTAFSTPKPVMVKLSQMHPDVVIRIDYAGELIGFDCGYYTLKDGQCVQDVRLPEKSKEAFEKSFELWPEDRELYVLVDNQYQFIED